MSYRRKIPPSVPRTMARAMVLPMEPPIDLPTLPATPPITRLVTDRVTSRATRWVGDSTLTARTAGAEQTAEHVADAAQNAAARDGLALRGAARGVGVLGALLQNLEGRLAVDRRVVLTLERALVDDRLALLRRDRTDPRRRRAHQASLHHRRRAVAFEEGHQRLALPQFGDHRGGIEVGILPERLGRSPHRFLIARREGAQRMLHAVSELRGHFVRHVERILGDEINADSLGADQPHHLLDLIEQRLGRVGEQEMRLVEEEHELRLLRIADLRHLLEQFGQHPEQERRVEPWVLHQLVGGEQIDHAAPVTVGTHEVFDVERRFAEELVGALVLEDQELPLDAADRSAGYVAVGLLDFRGLFRDESQYCPQVLEIEKRKPLIVGDAEGDIEHAFLRFVETKQTRQQQRSHFRDGGADRVALLAIEVPEHSREFVRLVFDPQILGALDERFLGLADRRNAGQIAFDVGGKDRDTALRSPRPKPAA